MEQEIKSKITNPTRIMRIISRMCEGRMQALIRTKQQTKVGIRSSFQQINGDREPKTLQFNGISEFGLKKLREGEPVKFEVIGMPTKVVFVARILEKTVDGLICPLPSSLVSIERRQNVRYGTTDAKMAYLKLSFWEPEHEDVAAPPVFEQFYYLASWLPIMDISAGGICVKTHFPSVLEAISQRAQDDEAQLILPMSDLLTIPVAFRWQRRIKNRILDGKRERYQLDFRVGLEFNMVSDYNSLRVKQFLRQLSVADAI